MCQKNLIKIPNLKKKKKAEIRPRRTNGRFTQTSLLMQANDIRTENSNHVHHPWLQYMYRSKLHSVLRCSVLDGRKETENRKKIVILCEITVHSLGF